MTASKRELNLLLIGSGKTENIKGNSLLNVGNREGRQIVKWNEIITCENLLNVGNLLFCNIEMHFPEIFEFLSVDVGDHAVKMI